MHGSTTKSWCYYRSALCLFRCFISAGTRSMWTHKSSYDVVGAKLGCLHPSCQRLLIHHLIICAWSRPLPSTRPVTSQLTYINLWPDNQKTGTLGALCVFRETEWFMVFVDPCAESLTVLFSFAASLGFTARIPAQPRTVLSEVGLVHHRGILPIYYHVSSGCK
ncbi:hypothetical protein EV421DRAFT_1246418 [Armillaria borealis]|uniref:Uncharacterized protein n=1 Tax=Armillaria borealis TaxID=47425 RepID=A0AA39J3B3_9AGAR|nr:hypothetical protein EV421DRAFT_1246418 [Armillaria borealis]